jgi:hypothetical protein
VGDDGRLDHPGDLQLRPVRAEPVEQPDAVAEEHRDEVDLQLVEQAAFRYCWTTLAPPPTATSLSPAAARACSSADSMPSVTNVNVVPPRRASGSRG